MNYTKIYEDIIENRKANSVDGYVENHHIIPKSLGGSNDRENIVALTAREHFICHYLLTRIYKYESFEWYKMNRAFMMMKMESSYQNRYFNSHLYESKRLNFSIVQSELQTGSKNSQFGTIWVHKKDVAIKISKSEFTEYTTLGWRKGRKLNIIAIRKLTKRYRKLRKEKIITKELTEMCEIYSKYGFEKFVELTNYKYSKQNLVQRFKKYVKSFKPQNGKKR